ncbi:MAG: lamin tail domain-containing protein [Actinomycetota bacterium]|nr:lamin tail domain-containing protein [Actinomycetota bacterium]
MRSLRFLTPLLLLAASCGPTTVIPTTAPPTSSAVSATTVTSPPGDNVEVLRVFDGDSLLALTEGGSELEVRLLGINAPEHDECHGDESRQTLQDRLSGGIATLVADEDDQDQFGRSLRYLYVAGVNVNLDLVQSGDALAIQTGHSLDEAFANSSDIAAETGRGMWAPGACGGSGDLPLVAVVDFVFDPRGRDADNLNGEWIAIANEGSESQVMSGWLLRDESTQNRFEFPNGFVLNGGDEVLVRTGCGSDSSGELYWCATDPVWSNGGDTIVVQQSDGTVVARHRYAGEF